MTFLVPGPHNMKIEFFSHSKNYFVYNFSDDEYEKILQIFISLELDWLYLLPSSLLSSLPTYIWTDD